MLENNSARLIYLNISKGVLTYKKDGVKQTTGAVSGIITAVNFKIENYQGVDYEQCGITIVDGEEKYQLQMNSDSGYFRGFCNFLKSGSPTERVKLAPNYKEVDGKKKSTCFVEQDGKALKAFHTKDNPGDYPQMEKVTFKGKDQWDGSNQITYWKNWLGSIKWKGENEAVLMTTNVTEVKVADGPKSTHPGNPNTDNTNDDLPF